MKGPSRIIAPHSHTIHGGYSRYRSWVATKHPSLRIANKILVSVAGILVIVVGLVLVPLPGPGWLIVFFGLSILGLEFPPIQRFTSSVAGKVKRLWRFLKIRLRARRAASAVTPASSV